jgi:hypothetical protein
MHSQTGVIIFLSTLGCQLTLFLPQNYNIKIANNDAAENAV